MKILRWSSLVALCLIGLLSVGRSVHAEQVTLSQALERAVGHTGRGIIIDGNLDVAEQRYFAEKINFYVPELSLNGSLPSYRVAEEYDFIEGTLDQKGVRRRTWFDFDADITLNQNLVTGGELKLAANLIDRDREYPLGLTNVNETWRLGTFNFSLDQPILQPSQARFDLHNSHDDLMIARLDKIEETATLKSEVIDAYFGVLRAQIADDIKRDKFESAQLQAGIDSIKLKDGIISEEGWLTSESELLDAELEKFDAENELAGQRKTLATVLDWEDVSTLEPVLPEMPGPLNDDRLVDYLSRWENCVTIQKARHSYNKSEREANFAAGGYGLQGSLKATYGLERGRVEDDLAASDRVDLDNNNWSVSLEFSYPIWDGGASAAHVKAVRLSADQSRLEYEKAQKNARAEIELLVNGLRISHRKVFVMQRQVDLAQNRLDIAKERLDDGEISMLTFLESRVTYLEAKDAFYQELQDFFKKQVELEGKFLN